MRRAVFFVLLVTIRTFADCHATKAPSQYSVEFHRPACDSSAPCVENQPVHFSVGPAAGCYIPFYPGPCPAPYLIDSCDVLTWDFGDGTTPKVVHGGEIDHAFPHPGEYTINVTMQNAAGTGTIRGSAYICADPPTVVSFTKERYDVAENGGTVTITLERSGDTARAFTLDYNTDPGAQAGAFNRNFEVIDQQLTFAPGETVKEITHRVQDDNIFLGDFDHSVGVVSHSGDVVMSAGAVTTAMIHLFDNEPGPEFSIDDVTVPEGLGRRTIDVPLHLSNPAGDYVYAWCVPHDGSAHAGSDFLLMGSSAVFNPGETSSKCQVTILGNKDVEPDKSFTITTDPVIGPVTVKRGTATFTMTNDDAKVDPPPPPPPPTQSLSFEPKKFQLSAGSIDSVSLYADLAATVTLTSSDPTIVQVDLAVAAPGPVRLVAQKPGTATITATDGAVSASIEVEVTGAPRRRAMR